MQQSVNQEEFFKRYTYSVGTDRIGGGGFGTVYRAKDNLLHRTVAIKVSEVKTTADGLKTFSLKDEFEALNHVPKHPNIANYEEFYSFESPQGIFDYAVMQYYPDGNLSNAIKQGLTAEQKDDIARQLLEGIAFLHQHKVVHRDLKPGNILVVRDGDKVIPLITDFGLSKAANAGDGSMFSNSFGGGTQRYSSPEQLQGQPLRFNTDLWSYGAIVYELFTGEALFSPGSGASNTAQADLEIYNKIIHGDVQNLGKMPEQWRKVAERCMVVDPYRRARNAEDLLQMVQAPVANEETSVSGISYAPPKQPQYVPPRPPQYNPPRPLRYASPQQPNKPKSKAGLWIALATVVAVALRIMLFIRPQVTGYVTGLVLGFVTPSEIEDEHVADSLAKVEQATAMPEKKTEAVHSQPTSGSQPKPIETSRPNEPEPSVPSQPSIPSAITGSTSNSLTITVKGVSFVMIKVDGGTFQMGSDDEEANKDEKPVHSVTVSGFYMGETVVTQALWKAVMGNNPSNWKDDNNPVERVTWNDCQKFIDKLNGLTRLKFRFPTEAEWEYAAKGGRKSKGYQYAGSDYVDEVAWYKDNSGDRTHPVKKKAPNELGLYDMSGNVWEWCQDHYNANYYEDSPSMNPQGPSDGWRVSRGGCGHDDAGHARVSRRDKGNAYYRFTGLRLVLNQDQ